MLYSTGSYSLSKTVYLPRDYQPAGPDPEPDGRVASRYLATEVHDWLMLGVTIAKKMYNNVKVNSIFASLISDL